MAELTDEQLIRLSEIQDGKTWYTNGVALDRACWNYALYGCEGHINNDPARLFDVVNAQDNNLNERLLLVPQVYRQSLRELRQQRINGGNVTHIIRSVVEIAIGIAELDIVPNSNYKLCMHWPTANGVTYEHWWIEVQGGITTEIIPAWGSIKIYRNRANDPEHYSQVSMYLRELKASHINQIMGVVLEHDEVDTPVIRDGHGWS